MQETQVWSLGQEDPLDKEIATQSSSLALKIPWTEEPGRLQTIGSQRVGHDWATSLHFKKIGDTEGTFHAKMGMKKYRSGMDLTEAKEIKRRWQEYTEELYKKGLNDPENQDCVITHLEPDILEYEV